MKDDIRGYHALWAAVALESMKETAERMAKLSEKHGNSEDGVYKRVLAMKSFKRWVRSEDGQRVFSLAGLENVDLNAMEAFIRTDWRARVKREKERKERKNGKV